MKTLRSDGVGGFPTTPAQQAHDKRGTRSAFATPAHTSSLNATPLNYTGARSTATNSTVASLGYVWKGVMSSSEAEEL